MGKNIENTAPSQQYYDKKAIGRRIRKLRLEHDISQEEFAESIDVSTNFVSELENGRKGMSVETLCNLTEQYQVTADYLLFGLPNGFLSPASLEEALSALPTEDIPVIIQYLQSLYKIRQLEDIGGYKR